MVSSPGCLTAIPSAIVNPGCAWHADDPELRPHRAQRERDAGREPTAADRDHDGADVAAAARPARGRSFPARRSRAGPRTHARRSAPVRSAKRERVGERLLEPLARELDLRAVRTGRFDLRHRRVLRDEDRRRTAGLARRPGDRLAVVAGARGDDPRAPLVVGPRVAIVLYAPRILNEPVRCRFSAFSQTSRPARRENVSEEYTGVSRATPASRSRAASISASSGAACILVHVEHADHDLPNGRQWVELALLHRVEQPPELRALARRPPRGVASRGRTRRRRPRPRGSGGGAPRAARRARGTRGARRACPTAPHPFAAQRLGEDDRRAPFTPAVERRGSSAPR